MQNNTVDVRAVQIIEQHRARWPRWRDSARTGAPRWFRGGELDVLEPQELRALYDDTRVPIPPSRWIFPVWALLYVLYRVIWLETGPTHWLSFTVIALYLALFLAIPLFRRWRVLRAARAQVRERPDWPQRWAERDL